MSREQIEKHHQQQAAFDRDTLAVALPQMALFLFGVTAVCLLLLS